MIFVILQVEACFLTFESPSNLYKYVEQETAGLIGAGNRIINRGGFSFWLC
jgi:hypothetical protein